MIVVSDTSPILNLARIGRLELLQSLYHQVLIISAVYQELADAIRGLPQIDLVTMPRLTVAAAHDRKRVQELRKDLDSGEAEATVLAVERRADLLLVDERRARRTATAAGLHIIGLLGAVASAERAGLIPLAEPVLYELVQTAKCWVDPDLYGQVLAELGEV